MTEAQNPPPPWLVELRRVVYFAAQYWWGVVPAVALLGRLCGLGWTGTLALGALALVVVLGGPFAFGVLVAVVSRSRAKS